ncbi:MAG: hypothetical protein K9J12_09030 [Melioribacteraceae bacterium]|nr:hypothetical protein [Melioribacteraceae bacterium]MCF8414477.1 hypothetical protein [Melioribacteraceae bacterium]
MKKLNSAIFIILLFCSLETNYAQNISGTHTRGKLWETIYNYGFIGDPGAWDYLQVTGIGFYPGFSGYTFPTDEFQANGFITDANFHNFRTGPWIIAKDAQTLVPPAFTPETKDFLLYHASLATGDMGVQTNIPPFQSTDNFVESANFDPLFPEEVNYTTFHTATGVTVKQRSMAWSFPGYDDFIIYDYVYKNTGKIALPSVNQVMDLEQTLDEVWFVFHSGIQVSTKGRINFHYDSDFLSSTAPAGSFGWHPGGGYTDYYAVENDAVDGKGLLYYSRDYNGGSEPVPWNQHGVKSNWQDLLSIKPEWGVELQDPSAFGFVFLYRTPPPGSNGDPFDADPTHFNIYSDEGDKFGGKTVDFEGFGLTTFSQEEIYQFATHDYRPNNSGRNYNWYTSSFGPYTLAPGDSVRIIVAEVAGVMDLWDVIMGDPNGNYPDSTISAIRRNTQAARNAIQWGVGATVNGIKIAADVPESPPAPTCVARNASIGQDSAIIAIQWNKLAEEVEFVDGSGSVFFDGAFDLDGYRVYRGIDKRGIWELIEDIPRAEFGKYYNAEAEMYEFRDTGLQFGFEYYYYVQAYNQEPGDWTSANGTLVENLPELASSDKNRTPLTAARPGPIDLNTKSWDVFVAPNPYIEGDPNHSFGEPTPRKIEFRNLPESATIKIYNLSGDLVRTLDHGPDDLGNLSGSAVWDQRSDSGLLVSPGLYVYVVRSNTEGTSGEKTSGKFMIIR